MKSLFFVAVVVLAAVVCAEETQYEYVPPEYPSAFSVEVETKTLLTYVKNKYYVNNHYIRKSTINYQGTLISDVVYRPDILAYDNDTELSYVGYWSYSATSGCTRRPLETQKAFYPWNEFEYFKNNSFTILFSQTDPALKYFTIGDNFTNRTETKYRGKDCYVYFDIDLDALALYVDKSNNYLVGLKVKSYIPDQRTEYTFTFNTKCELSDFTFQKKYVYNCTDNAIMDAPKNANVGENTVASSPIKRFFSNLFSFLF